MKWLLLSTFLSLAFGQLAPPAGFEVASVKAAAPSSSRSSMQGGPDTADPERIVFTNVTLTSVLLRAYNIESFQVRASDWMSSSRYDITAQVPPGASKEQFNLMLQALLADRFHLILHHETKQLRGYELVRGKTEPKLKRSAESGPDIEPTEQPKTDPDGFPQLSAPGLVLMEGMRGTTVVSMVVARAQPLSRLTQMLSREFRMPVRDQTGLIGNFDFKLEFAPQAPGALPPESPDDTGSNLVSAIPQQLGLKLESRNVPVDILVIDSANRSPTGN